MIFLTSSGTLISTSRTVMAYCSMTHYGMSQANVTTPKSGKLETKIKYEVFVCIGKTQFQINLEAASTRLETYIKLTRSFFLNKVVTGPASVHD